MRSMLLVLTLAGVTVLAETVVGQIPPLPEGANAVKSAGTYTVRWNAADLPSGVYFYQMQAGSFSETKKLILQK